MLNSLAWSGMAWSPFMVALCGSMEKPHFTLQKLSVVDVELVGVPLAGYGLDRIAYCVSSMIARRRNCHAWYVKHLHFNSQMRLVQSDLCSQRWFALLRRLQWLCCYPNEKCCALPWSCPKHQRVHFSFMLLRACHLSFVHRFVFLWRRCLLSGSVGKETPLAQAPSMAAVTHRWRSTPHPYRNV